MKIEVFFFVLLSFVVGLVIGYGMSDGDLLSYQIGEELRLERDLVVSNKVNNRFTLPAGTFLYHLSSSKWNDVLVIKIIFEEGIIEEITSPIPGGGKYYFYYQESPTLQEIIENDYNNQK